MLFCFCAHYKQITHQISIEHLTMAGTEQALRLKISVLTAFNVLQFLGETGRQADGTDSGRKSDRSAPRAPGTSA